MDTNSPDSHIASTPQLRFGKIDELASRVGAAIAAARQYLFSKQHEEGQAEAHPAFQIAAIAVRALVVRP